MVKIEAGKSYRTQNGRVIGPMESYASHAQDGFIWQGMDRVTGVPRYYRADGTRTHTLALTLVAEWTEVNPPVAVSKREVTDVVAAVFERDKCSCEWLLVLREGCKCGGC